MGKKKRPVVASDVSALPVDKAGSDAGQGEEDEEAPQVSYFI